MRDGRHRRTKRATLEHRRNLLIGTAAMVVGVVVAIAGALFAHFTGLPEVDALERDIYPAVPRGWALVLVGQIVSLSGVLLAMGGATLAFLYKREMTWARASLGAGLFTALMMILFGVIPNEWLTLTQSQFEWTPQNVAFSVPRALVLNNDVSISYAAIKDIVSGTYVIVVLAGVGIAMSRWQRYQKKLAEGPPPTPVSAYGRPVQKPEPASIGQDGG